MSDRVTAQLTFLAEADKLKSVVRANVVMDGSRRENTAEHSWHLALWALVFAPADVDLGRVLAMCLLHDLIEIDAGDHPIHLTHDPAQIVAKETAAADRLYGLLPPDQGQALRAIWEEFETGATRDAQFARLMDHTQPMFSELANPAMGPAERDIFTQIMTLGRGATLKDRWPEVYEVLDGRLNRRPHNCAPDLNARLRFLAEADALKHVLRQTTLHDGSRRENSGEHSWHVALFALVLSEHAPKGTDTTRAIQMMILHDLVEIDAGDTPLHAPQTGQEDAERRAADRLFGLLPDGARLRALWDEFEARETPTARFAKAMDRAQPPQSNLATDGANWRRYAVTQAQITSRVGTPIQDGAPAVWAALAPQIDAWFAAQG